MWAAFADKIGRRLIPSAKVLLMPSTEGLEIPIAISMGFKEENIFAVDRSAAILATARWRKTYPAVNIYAGELGHAMSRIAKDGHKLMAANYDLCGPFSGTMITAVTEAARSGALDACCVIALTMLKGREDAAAIAALRLLHGKQDEKSEIRLYALLDIHAREALRMSKTIIEEEYKSGTQKMVFNVSQTYTLEFAEQEIRARAKINKIEGEAISNYQWFANNHHAKLCSPYGGFRKSGCLDPRHNDRYLYDSYMEMRNEYAMNIIAARNAIDSIVKRKTSYLPAQFCGYAGRLLGRIKDGVYGGPEMTFSQMIMNGSTGDDIEISDAQKKEFREWLCDRHHYLTGPINLKDHCDKWATGTALDPRNKPRATHGTTSPI